MSIRYEFRYGNQPKDGQVTVAINAANSYDKRLSTLNHMAVMLKEKISFAFELTKEPDVVILGGDRRKKMPSVEFGIKANIPDHEILCKLEEAGFIHGFELSLH